MVRMNIGRAYYIWRWLKELNYRCVIYFSIFVIFSCGTEWNPLLLSVMTSSVIYRLWVIFRASNSQKNVTSSVCHSYFISFLSRMSAFYNHTRFFSLYSYKLFLWHKVQNQCILKNIFFLDYDSSVEETEWCSWKYNDSNMAENIKKCVLMSHRSPVNRHFN